LAERAEPMAHYSRPMLQKGVIRGIPRTTHSANLTRIRASLGSAVARDADKSESDRKTIRTATLELIVEHPAEAAEKIRTLAEQNGEFLVSSEVRGRAASSLSASRRRKSRPRMSRGNIPTGMPTFRNLKAEEQQYLLILKQAKTVKDKLDVSEKLSDVRGQIEQQQAEFNAD